MNEIDTPLPAAETDAKVLALCGGVGGAKLALGLYRVLAPGNLTIAINTGDDFEHLGLHVSPDIDTVTYTLADISDKERGWGLPGETWQFMAAIKRLGGEAWFNLGDQDLATHVLRTMQLTAGDSLSAVTAAFASKLGIHAHLLPMSDGRVRTTVHTTEGDLAFQRYFVERQCAPEVRGISFDGAENARPHPVLLEALADPTLAAIVICPSNPYLSVDPLLALPGLREALANAPAPVVAVSPIVKGSAIKGPTAKIMGELGLPVKIQSIAKHYSGLIDGLIVDSSDMAEASSLGIPVSGAEAIMSSIEDREALARAVIQFARSLGSGETH